jgi:hypothetical protein
MALVSKGSMQAIRDSKNRNVRNMSAPHGQMGIVQMKKDRARDIVGKGEREGCQRLFTWWSELTGTSTAKL